MHLTPFPRLNPARLPAPLRRPGITPLALLLAFALAGAGSAAAQTFTALTALTPDKGISPKAGLLYHNGLFYGTTTLGGNGFPPAGTIFSVTPDGTTLLSLHDFNSATDGASPQGELVASGTVLYGTAQMDGPDGGGVVFKFDTDGNNFAVLKAFSTLSPGYGVGPAAGLVLDGTTLYGTTSMGGNSDAGVIFKITDITTTPAFSIVKSLAGDGSEGAGPLGMLVLSGGTLYGTTFGGGSAGFGTVFKIGTDGNNFSAFKHFAGGANDGAAPLGGLVLSADGNTLYGTTSQGGSGGFGTVFSLHTSGSPYALLKQFADGPGEPSTPSTALILDNGVLYGTTPLGGSGGLGTVFKIGTDGNGFTLLKQFPTPPEPPATNDDGGLPEGRLTLHDGVLYGLTGFGGSADGGVFFSLTIPVVLSSNANLSDLTLSAGMLTPTFASGTISYTATVPNGTASLTVTPTRTDANASIQVRINGGSYSAVTSGTPSGSLSLNVGANTVEVLVTAQDNSAKTYTVTVTRAKADQVISFASLGNKTLGDAPFTVSATGGGSGEPVTFSIVSNPANATATGVNGSTITLTGAGTVTVRASQAGNANYNAATPIDQSFTVAKMDQTITFGTLANKTFGDVPFTVSATGGGSGEPVTFSIVSDPAKATATGVNGSLITLTGAGTVTVRASQAGSANYNAATPVDRTFTVAKANQTITFAAIPDKQVTDSAFNLSATASSGLTVSFTLDTTPTANPPTINGSQVILGSGLGEFTITATQAGNDDYNAAATVQQSFMVFRFTKLADFAGTSNGASPQGNLYQATDGVFYGTTLFGGTHNKGTIFKLTTDGTLTRLAEFSGAATGANPANSLVADANGDLWGLTTAGGANDLGAVFKVSPSGQITLMASFDGTVLGANPWGGLLPRADGTFLGMTAFGGTDNKGVIFSVTQQGTVTKLQDFDGATKGAAPLGSLSKFMVGNDEYFFGVTSQGGANNQGALFTFIPGAISILAKNLDFNGSGLGATPKGNILLKPDGTDAGIYMLTSGGGADGAGALVFHDGSSSHNKLADFVAAEHGSGASGALLRTVDGNFFGLAPNGGANNLGTIFRAKANGSLKRMASFPVGGGLNGANPFDSLIQGADGALYGTTAASGANNFGTVFKIETGLPALNRMPANTSIDIGNVSQNDGLTAGALSVTDLDASQTHTLRLVAGAGDTDNAAFIIEGNSLKLANPGSFQPKPSYSIRVRATDNGTPPLAQDMQISFNLPKRDQTITFNAPATKSVLDGAFALNASASSGLLVTFTRVSGPATLSGNTATPNGGGDFVVQADQAGNALYNPAPQVSRTITITAPPNTAPSFTLAGEWTERRMDANDTGKPWNGVASSADGTKLAAVVHGGRIYTSTDSGVTWTARDTDRNWQQLVSSADGVTLVASESEVDTPGFIYVSSDSGVTWTQRGNHLRWGSLASSADGSKLVAAVTDGGIWTSANSGLTWRPEGTGIRNWRGLASSADGSKLVVLGDGKIYTSTDFGANFTPQPGAGDDAWKEVASSTNGAKLVATAGSRLYTSTDSGVTWIQRLEKSALWFVASSADGSRLVTSDVVSRNPRASIFDATIFRDGRVYTSKDSGVTWTEWNLPHVIGPVASSADGTKLVAASAYGSIYTLDLSVRERRVADGAGPQTVSNFAQNINPGPGIESVQVVDFLVSNDNSSLFSVQPALSASGTLTYTPAVGANGTATVTVRAHDNGINTGGGSDTSEAQTFTITVFPSVNLSGNRTEGLILNGQPLANTSGNPITVSGTTLISGNTGVARGNVTFSGPFVVSGTSTFEVKDTVTISGQMTASPAGSTFVKTGPGTLVIDGANFNGTITVQQGTVIVRGANGDTCYTVAGSSTLASSGSMRCQTVRAGSRIAPGASPGSFTTLEEAVWEARSIYEWEINNAIGTAGTDPGWDKINIGGTLTLSGTLEQPGNLLSGPIIIALKSLTSGNADGPMANFNNATAYSWTIASAAGGVVGFTPSIVNLDTNGIANDLGGGVFTISKPNATDLVVSFIPAAQHAAPTDIMLLGTTIAEANNFGATIGQFSAVDANTSDNHTYTLVSGTGDTDNVSFRTVGSALQAAAVFDYEVKNTYSIRVRATDAGGLFTEKQFTITVTDVVESATFQPGQIAFVDGKIQLKLQSSGNLLWRIDASNDLSTWTPVTTTTPGTDGILSFVDPDSGSHPRRFYRAVLAP